MNPADAQRTVKRLYRQLSGFEIPRTEERRIRKSKGSPLYGEITPASVRRLIEYLELDESDVLYDLGAGIGKLVIQAAMSVPLRACIGVELSPTRCRMARSVLARARADGLIRAHRCNFRSQDLMAARLGDASAVYTCSTGFSLRFMKRLVNKLAGCRPGLTLVSAQCLEPNRYFEPVTRLRLDMSWHRGSGVYVYRLRNRRAEVA